MIALLFVIRTSTDCSTLARVLRLHVYIYMCVIIYILYDYVCYDIYICVCARAHIHAVKWYLSI